MSPERRGSARHCIALDLTLSRRKGSAITCRTVDLGDGGMRVATQRPLAIDEVVGFDVVLGADQLHGEARVLRQHSPTEYALRFESLPDGWAQAIGGFVTTA